MQDKGELPGAGSIVGCFAALYGIGYLSYILSPVMIGAVVTGLGLDEGEAGMLASSELGALALTVIALAGRMATIDRKKLAAIGVALVIAGHAASALSPGFAPLVASRVLAGVGLGAMIAVGNASVAGTAAPQRVFAFAFTLGQFQAAALLIFVLPDLIERWSYAGGYGFLAVWSLLMAPLLRLLPEHEAPGATTAASTGWKLFLLPTVLAMVLIGAADSSVWTFTERIALSLDMSLEQAGNVLALALIAGVLGSLAAALLGTRWGEWAPILVGSLLLATAYFSVATAGSAGVYSVAQVAVLGCYGFIVPYLFGVNGRLDPEGRVMVAGSAAHLIGTGVGPAIAGQIILALGYPGVGIAVAVMTTVCGAAFVLRLRTGEQGKPLSQREI